jgi:hypothetical protein
MISLKTDKIETNDKFKKNETVFFTFKRATSFNLKRYRKNMYFQKKK